MEIGKAPNKSFKLPFLRKLNQLQGNTEREFTEVRKAIPEQNEIFNK